MAINRKALALSGLFSFALHAMPLFNPHGLFLVGGVIWNSRDVPEDARLQTALFLLAVFAGQALLMSLLYFFFSKPGWGRFGGLLLSLIPFAFLFQILAIMGPQMAIQMIPVHAPPTDLGNWPEVCGVSGLELSPIQIPVNNYLSDNGLTPVQNINLGKDSMFGIMRMPGCTVEKGTLIPYQNNLGQMISANGNLLIDSTKTEIARKWSVATPAGTVIPIELPMSYGNTVFPILSDDGSAIGYFEPGPLTFPRTTQKTLVIHTLAEGTDKRYAFDFDDANVYFVLELDLTNKEIMVLLANSRLAIYGLDEKKRDSLDLGRIRFEYGRFIWGKKGWVGIEEDPKTKITTLHWSLNGHAGSAPLAMNSSISRLAVDPSGRWIAVLGANKNIRGQFQQLIFVFDAQSGAVVWRRASSFAGNAVAFPATGFFAYNTYTPSGGIYTIHVLKIPEAKENQPAR